MTNTSVSKIPLVYTPKTETRIDFLDALRACAILPVVVGHQNTLRYPGGALGVYIFFCLSGYLITQFLIERNIKDRQGLFAFWIRRFFRIYPMYVFTVVTSLIFLFHKKPEDAALVESMLIPLFSFWKLPPANGHFFYYSYGVLWTLHVELWFYFLFAPFVVFFNRLNAPSELAIAIFCLFCFIISILISSFPIELEEQMPSLVSFVKFAKYLIIGAIAAVFKQRKIFENLSLTANRVFASFSVLLIVVMFLIAKVHISPNWFEYALLVDIGIGFLVLSLFQLRLPSHLPILAWIGRISYSLYLVHAMVLDFAPLSIRLNLFLYLSACLGLAWLTYHFIELPGIRFGRYTETKILLKTKDRYQSSAPVMSNCTVELTNE